MIHTLYLNAGKKGRLLSIPWTSKGEYVLSSFEKGHGSGYQRHTQGTRQMAQQLRVLAALPEFTDLSSLASRLFHAYLCLYLLSAGTVGRLLFLCSNYTGAGDPHSVVSDACATSVERTQPSPYSSQCFC